ncbi:RNA binding motif-containing protein [Nitzschia inconspicua]|uniref:RNA binding motif-containing protein n=1 Tax=Nitzschia inconspicua TaxID=303405 RepID=A0A9K3LMF2_9STRA|nr:RNA binding motif-containing protein [Nitzschia inconspicua]
MTEEIKKEESDAVADVHPPAPAAVEAKQEESLCEEDLKAVEGIKERLKFFFSNANVRQDMFIRKLLTQSEDKAVPVEVMMRFNTIKKFSEKPEVVVKAAKELSDLLIVDEDKSMIRRVKPFTNDMMKENLHLSLHVKNLPVKEEEAAGEDDDNKNVVKTYNVTIDEVRALFEKYGDIALIKLQFVTEDNGKHGEADSSKKRRKIPAGTALVEFHDLEELKKAAEATLTIKDGEKVEPKEKVILPAVDNRKEPIELEVMLLSEFVQSKRNDRKGNTKRNAKRDRENVDDDDANEPSSPPKFTIDWKPGCVIKLKGVPESCDREAMLECLAKGLETDIDGVKSRKIYVDFSRGQQDGAIRFPDPSDNIAELAKRLKEGDLKINDTKVEEVYVLEGEEETKYWEDFMAFKTRQVAQRHEKKRHKSHHRSR